MSILKITIYTHKWVNHMVCELYLNKALKNINRPKKNHDYTSSLLEIQGGEKDMLSVYMI